MGFNNDGVDDIVTTTQGGTGRLRVFDGLTGEMFDKGAFSEEFAVFDGVHDKGAFVAVGDVTGDGLDDIVFTDPDYVTFTPPSTGTLPS